MGEGQESGDRGEQRGNYVQPSSVSAPPNVPSELVSALPVLVEPVPLDVASPAMTVLYFYSSHGLQAVVPEALLMHMHEYC